VDWREPRVGINILNSFFKPTAFGDGIVRCSDAFQFGMALGRDLKLRDILGAVTQESAKTELSTRLIWSFFELSALLEEVRLLADAALNVESPEKPLAINGDPANADTSYGEPLIEWFAKEFLQQSPAHCLFFELGLNSPFFL